MTPTDRRRGDGVEEWRRLVDADIAVLKRDVTGIQEWVTTSRRFHERVNSFIDTFNATQARIEKEQARRHQDNQDAMQKLGSKVSVGMLIVAILGLMFTALGIAVAYQAGRNHAKLLPVSAQAPTEYHASTE